jgi:hypothetical protein
MRQLRKYIAKSTGEAVHLCFRTLIHSYYHRDSVYYTYRPNYFAVNVRSKHHKITSIHTKWFKKELGYIHFALTHISNIVKGNPLTNPDRDTKHKLQSSPFIFSIVHSPCYSGKFPTSDSIVFAENHTVLNSYYLDAEHVFDIACLLRTSLNNLRRNFEQNEHISIWQ